MRYKVAGLKQAQLGMLFPASTSAAGGENNWDMDKLAQQGAKAGVVHFGKWANKCNTLESHKIILLFVGAFCGVLWGLEDDRTQCIEVHVSFRTQFYGSGHGKRRKRHVVQFWNCFRTNLVNEYLLDGLLFSPLAFASSVAVFCVWF